MFDLEREIQFEGYWETMSTQGGITLTVSIKTLQIVNENSGSRQK